MTTHTTHTPPDDARTAKNTAPTRTNDATNAQPAPPVTVRPATPAPAHAAQTPKSDHKTTRVFVSPRVLDQNAFDELAANLKQLLDDADDRAAAVADAAHKLTNTEARITKLAARQREQLELASRVLTAVDQRAAKAEQAAATNAELAKRLDTIEQRLQTLEQDHTDTPDLPATPQTLPGHLKTQLEQHINQHLDSLTHHFDHTLATTLANAQHQTAADTTREKAAIEALIRSATDARLALENALEHAETEQLAALAADANRAAKLLNGHADTPPLTELITRAEHAASSLAISADEAHHLAHLLADLTTTTNNAEAARDELQHTLPKAAALTASLPARACGAADAAANLDHATTAANRAASRTAAQLDQLATLITAGEAVLARLEPWRNLIDNPADEQDATLPPAFDAAANALAQRISDIQHAVNNAILNRDPHQNPNP